ncbi:RNA polymerase sigma factor [Ructibacterium gallinarum]|uniref:Sigma-70 family RNA polymerase sigma factor n=1 Tax=Ructibacterium gallinarum TaxID=2779355 RepID=A0A9D5LWT7_9FIRM|nr:sigma-70 family RNA polymerase sigma factor [Ructibacterium gallinarum]MBE5039213.1 sigma-70 family RNA polymerase sigma factor [Ructibacterium gallinarum]
MNHSVRPADDAIEKTVDQYADMLFRLCFTILGSSADAEDAVSDTFLRYLTKAPEFHSPDHEKAWLIRVAVNISKDMLRARKRHGCICLDEISQYVQTPEESTILEEVLLLPEKYKTVLYLFYIEGYQTGEIGRMLAISPAAVRKRLQYGREMLRMQYGKDGSK